MKYNVRYVEKFGVGPHTATDILIHSGTDFIAVENRDTGEFCIPGGFLEADQTLKGNAYKELKEEVGLEMPDLIHPLFYWRYFDDLYRDNRARIITHVFTSIAMKSETGVQCLRTGKVTPFNIGDINEVKSVCWINVNDIDNYVWRADHKQIIQKFYDK